MTECLDDITADDNRARFRSVKAGVQHLIDLKRAGHSPRFTELRVNRDDRIISQPERRAPVEQRRSRA